MLPVAASADQTTDLMKNLALDSQNNTRDASEVTKKTSSGNGEAPNVSAPPREPTITPLLQEVNNADQAMNDPANRLYMPSAYPSPAYVYRGGGPVADWGDYNRYVNQEGVDMASGAYRDVYGYSYLPYGAYPSADSSVPSMGNDGQLYGTQHYQYPAPYYQPPTAPSAPYAPPTSHGASSPASDKALPPSDTAKATPNGTAKGNSNLSNGSAYAKTNQQSYARGAMPGGLPTSGYQDHRHIYGGVRSPTPCMNPTLLSAGQHRAAASATNFAHISSNSSQRNQNQRPFAYPTGSHNQRATSGMGLAPGFLNKTYPNTQMYGAFGNPYRTGFGYGFNSYDSRINGYWNMSTDNMYRPRGRINGFYGYGKENSDELSRGPRSGRFKNPKAAGPNAKEENPSAVVLPDTEQYNREDFPVKYSNAKFFIIKSYSEDDIHRSIKYSVWASTPNGNKKLDDAYKEAQVKAGECPVFLLFSVNTSGQFVGLAEMIGPVDFDKTMDYWQQDKWFGCFAVKWHIVKDIPNSILKHITLEYNDNKPVTNSRDTQEVRLEEGLQMLRLFKEHVSKTSVLDDFEFYETRQKSTQEKRVKQQQLQKQALDGKNAEAVDEKEKVILHRSLESDSLPKKEAAPEVAGDASEAANFVAENPVAIDGGATDC